MHVSKMLPIISLLFFHALLTLSSSLELLFRGLVSVDALFSLLKEIPTRLLLGNMKGLSPPQAGSAVKGRFLKASSL